MRAPQDEDGRARAELRLVAEPFAVIRISRCQTAHLVPAAHFLRPGFATSLHSPRIEGWAERRETFGCSGTRGACPHASKTRVNALSPRHARRLARRLAPHDAAIYGPK